VKRADGEKKEDPNLFPIPPSAPMDIWLLPSMLVFEDFLVSDRAAAWVAESSIDQCS